MPGDKAPGEIPNSQAERSLVGVLVGRCAVLVAVAAVLVCGSSVLLGLVMTPMVMMVRRHPVMVCGGFMVCGRIVVMLR